VYRKLLVVTSVAALLGASGFCVLAGHAPAQLGPPQAQSQAEKEMLERQAKEANKKRQDDIRNDTTKLLQLATELKDAVDKSNEHVLSVDVVRKADEVEHLAHRVKEKMKESVGPPRNEPVPLSRP
jgi:predicted methyltransferase